MAEPSTHERQVRVLVQGGMGSGKSTVAKVFARLGAIVIEADSIGREILDPGGRAFDDVANRWPQAVRDGVIDRKALAAVVFTDLDQLLELEAITHPLIEAEILARVAAASPAPVVVEVALAKMLLADGWVRVVVDTDEKERVRRAVARGFDERDTRARVRVQPDRTEWLAQADHVINNCGSIAELESAAAAIWGLIVATSA